VAKNGDLVVLCSGWRNNKTPWTLLPVAVARSGDNGRTWTHHTEFPLPGEGWNDFVPFGDIIIGSHGTLHASCYARKTDDNRERFTSWFLSSYDDGNTWEIVSIIGPNNNETTILHLGGKNWLAGGRRNPPPDGASPDEPNRVVDLFYSNDNGASWQGPRQFTNDSQHPGHLLLLDDGRILFTYGNRSNAEGGRGVLAKLSNDGGKTWSPPVRIAHLGGDLGYPSSIQRADGKIVTAYYSSGVENHQRYHMGAAIWEVPERIGSQALILESIHEPQTGQEAGVQISIPQGISPGTTIHNQTHGPSNNANSKGVSENLPVEEKKYLIGDFAQGGVVFWVDETGQHGLVCAKTDQGTGAKWFPDPRGYRSAKASDHYLLAGSKNTERIIAAQEAMGDDDATYAARICSDLQITEGGKTYAGWHLPSIRELNQMYIHRTTINTVATAKGGTAFAGVNYWSSTQCTGEQAWTRNFGNGLQKYYSKGFRYRVRAIRAF
jgi:hypothetical protein